MTTQTNLGGRPRIHDRDKIAEELIEWAALPNSINLCKFCCSRKPPMSPRQITDWAKEDTQFLLAYETAKAFLGARREEWLNQDALHVKGYDLNARTYDHFLKDEHRDESSFQSSLKQQEVNAYTEEDKKSQEALIEQFVKAQDASSARRAAETINKSDEKS